METVMLALGGKAYWDNIWGKRDDTLVRGPVTRKVFETFRRLSTYADDGAAGRTWPDNVNLLITNKGAFNVMGDWAKGEFKAAGKVAEVDYGCILPGEKPWWLIQADMFAVPAGTEPDRKAAQNLLAHVAMEKDVQVGFNLNKGSLPPRTDVPRDQFDACAEERLRLLYQSGPAGRDRQHVLHAEGCRPLGRSSSPSSSTTRTSRSTQPSSASRRS